MANIRKIYTTISGMFSRNQSNSNGLDSRDPPIVPNFDYDADVKEHSQCKEDYKKHGSQPVEAESEPKDHIYNIRYPKKIKSAKETIQKAIKLTHDSQIIPFEYSKSSAWPDFVASLEQQIYDMIDSIARTDPLIASLRDSIACDIILDAINDFVKSNYMTQELKNQFYDRIIDEVDKDKMVQAGENSLVSGEKAFTESAYIKLFVSMINKCRSDYRLLHLFCKHRDILERNIRRQIDEKSKTSKFIFYGLINDYININGPFTTNYTVDEMEKFVKSLYNMFVNTIILHSLTRKQGLSKDRIMFIERRFFDYRDTFESETGIDIFAQEIANLEKDKRIPKVDYVSLQCNGDLVLKTLQFILKNPGIRNDLEPDLAILQNEHVSDIVDFLGFKENSEVFKTCGLSHNVMKNPVKLSNNHICYDYASIIQTWVEEQKLQKEMSYTFMEPYAQVKCDIRDFIFDELEVKRTKIFFLRGGSFSKLLENYNVFMSIDYKGMKFEEILKDVCDKRITDKAHKDAVLKKFVGDQTIQSENAQ